MSVYPLILLILFCSKTAIMLIDICRVKIVLFAKEEVILPKTAQTRIKRLLRHLKCVYDVEGPDILYHHVEMTIHLMT